MKVLLLNQAFYPDVVSTAQHLADVAAGLAAKGHQVTVLSSRRAYNNPHTLFAKRQLWRSVRILRLKGTGLGKRAKWQRALDFGSFAALCGLRALFLARQDVVVALSSPPLVSVLGLLLAKLWHARLIYWVMDLNPDEAVAAGWLQTGSLPTRLLDWASRLSLRKADRVIVLDRFMFARICEKGLSPQRVSILAPWSHDDHVRFDLEGRRRFRKRHRLAGKFVVMYSGNHSPCHSLDTLTAAAERFAGDKDIVFCFVGGGSEFEKVCSLADAAFGGSNPSRPSGTQARILCLPYQPLEQLSDSLSAADLHIVVLGDRFVGLVHPCKIYNVLRIGAPVIYIGPCPSSVTDALASADGSVLSASLRHGDVEGLVHELERIRGASAAGQPCRHFKKASEFAQATQVGAFIALLEKFGST